MTMDIIVCVGLYGVSQFAFEQLLAAMGLEKDVKNLRLRHIFHYLTLSQSTHYTQK
jgi:hypothetical protein